MNRYEFRRVSVEDIPKMCELLMDRQNLEGESFPCLKNSCLNEKHIKEVLEELFEECDLIGMGAFLHGELIGYIVGEMKIDSLRGRGRHIWIPYEGIAIKKDGSYEVIREIYSRVSALWVERGYFNHHVFVPLGDKKYLEGIQRVGFFIDHVYGVMNMNEYEPFDISSDAEIRLAKEEDSEIMGNMSTIIFSSLNSAPTFLPVVPEIISKINNGYKGIVEDDEATILIAEKNKKEQGFLVYEPIEPDLMAPDEGVELSIAGTYISQRGSGIGKKLMNEGFRIMKEKGYDKMMADWKMTNLSASTFWPKCGFKPICYRMVRNIDSNVAWANFNNLNIE